MHDTYRFVFFRKIVTWLRRGQSQRVSVMSRFIIPVFKSYAGWSLECMIEITITEFTTQTTLSLHRWLFGTLKLVVIHLARLLLKLISPCDWSLWADTACLKWSSAETHEVSINLWLRSSALQLRLSSFLRAAHPPQSIVSDLSHDSLHTCQAVCDTVSLRTVVPGGTSLEKLSEWTGYWPWHRTPSNRKENRWHKLCITQPLCRAGYLFSYYPLHFSSLSHSKSY